MNALNLSDTMVVMINLDRAQDRRTTMDERLSQLGLSYERFSAIDGSANWDDLKQSVDITAFQRNTGRDVMKGEIGCYHSHLAVWRKLVATDAQHALILEDDVVFKADFAKAVGVALRHQSQWDFLKFNKIRAQWPVPQFSADEYTFQAYRGPSTGFGCYMIKRDLAERLLPEMLPITRPIDIEADRIHVHRYRHLGIEPFPSCVDDGGVSTITGNAFDNVNKYPWYKRLQAYWIRWQNLIAKHMYLKSTSDSKT